jgi:two-component system response regulator RpaA
MSTNILVIEDDEIVARVIERSLRGEEFKVTIANSGVDGLKMARRAVPDLVILDVIMPGMDGYTVCREMRNDPLLMDVPVLFLTAKIKDEDRIAGFQAGGDDYLCKPFNIEELTLRVRAILRRTQNPAASPQILPASAGNILDETPAPQGQSVLGYARSQPKAVHSSPRLEVENYVLDARTFELHTPDRGRLRLTPVQFDLLYYLMSHPGQIFSPGRLLDEVWDYPSDTGSPDLVRVHIKNLRERIESDPANPRFIRTVPGYGYTVGGV